MHTCTGPGCGFCSWRKQNPIELGWERLLDSDDAETYGRASASTYGVELSSSQIEDPYKELSTQQTTDFLENFDCDDYFPKLDSDFEQILSQVDRPVGNPCSKELPALVPVSSAVDTPIAASYCCTTTTLQLLALLLGLLLLFLVFTPLQRVQKLLTLLNLVAYLLRLRSRPSGRLERGLSGLLVEIQSFSQANNRSALHLLSSVYLK